MAELWSKIFFLAITPKKELFWFIQNYTHTLWTSIRPKIWISEGASFFNLMQHPGDQCGINIYTIHIQALKKNEKWFFMVFEEKCKEGHRFVLLSL